MCSGIKIIGIISLISSSVFGPIDTHSDPPDNLSSQKEKTNKCVIEFKYSNPKLWDYLRKGLNYLESPAPLAAPEATPPGYIHPDGKGFGAYGFSPAAYSDVQRLYAYFKNYSWEDVLASQELYDMANQAYADWLLSRLKEYIPPQSTASEVFDALQQAWNLGLSGFKQGRQVVASRSRRAEEFKQNYFVPNV